MKIVGISILLHYKLLFYLVQMINSFYRSNPYKNVCLYKIIMSEIQLVIARYNENLDYLDVDPFSKYSQIIYNKGSPIYTEKDVIDLENLGRESHTYLYHIIKNYDNLAEVTYFLPGSCLDQLKKWQTMRTFKLLEGSRNTVFISSEMVGDVKNHAFDWCIGEYVGGNSENQKQLNNNGNHITIADIRPFGNWFDHVFGDLHTHVICYRCIFAVSREHIRQHSREYYENLIQYVSGSQNPEYGHYFERAWLAVFYPVPNSCVY